MIYQNLKELGNNTLKIGDIVYFHINGKILRYFVHSEHLSNTGHFNEEIFSILDISKNDFCNYHYGYYPYGGDWPISKQEDYAALTRVVKALYQEIERREIRKESNPYNYLSDVLSDKIKKQISLLSEKKETTSSNIITKRKLKIKRIIGEEQIKLNNY